MDQGEDKSHRYNQHCEKNEMVLGRAYRNTIFQRTAQDRLTWIRHAEAFAQPRDTTAAE